MAIVLFYENYSRYQIYFFAFFLGFTPAVLSAIASICFIGRGVQPAPFAFHDFLLSALSSVMFLPMFLSHFFSGIVLFG